MTGISRCLACLPLALACVSVHATTDTPSSVISDVQNDADAIKPEAPAEGARSFIVLPIPLSNPAVGSGLVLVGTVFYKPDTAAQPWVSGVGLLGTDNKSRALAAFQKADFDQDRFRLSAGVGHADVNVKFYGIGPSAGDRGAFIPIEQVANAVLFKGLMRVRDSFYAGVNYRYVDVDTQVRGSALPNPDLQLPDLELKSIVSLLGMNFEYDTRDQQFAPRAGSFVEMEAGWSRGAFGSDFHYDTQTAAANHYMTLNDSLVLAARVKFCHVGTGAPFYSLCLYGADNDLRGYETGRYRDDALFAAQAELRWQFSERWGGVAFAGTGGVGKDFGSIDTMLPAGGVGVRFLASTAYHVNARLDYAVGKDGSTIYFSIGEAF